MSTFATSFDKTDRNRIRRIPDRGHYDRESIYPIVDDTLICHVGFVQDGQPFVIPTIHARVGDTVLLHGATTSRMLKQVQAGGPVCLTMTVIDGLVLARSVFHHSMNYRSAVLFGTGTLIEDEDAKMEALERFTEKLMPGRWTDARQPNRRELKATSVVSIAIESASAKVRIGPPGDDDEDYALPVWAGVVPFHQQIGALVPDPKLSAGIPLPGYVQAYVENGD